MDFEHERYVRLYTRDSIKYLRLGWKGEAVFTSVLRKLDRRGCISLGDCPLAEAVEIITRLPREVVEDGLERCLKVGFLTVEDGELLSPGFFDAQEAKASAKLRKEKQRELEKSAQQQRASSGPPVTKRDHESQDATESHQPSHAVTSCHSVLCRTVPYRAVLEGDARDPGADSEDKTPHQRLCALVKDQYVAWYINGPGAGMPPGTGGQFPKHVALIAEHIAVAPEPAKYLAEALAGFEQDEKAKQAKYPIGFLSPNPNRYVNTADGPGGAASKARAAKIERDCETQERQLQADQDNAVPPPKDILKRSSVQAQIGAEL